MDDDLEQTLSVVRIVARDAFALLQGEERAWARDFVLRWDDDNSGNVTALSNDSAAATADVFSSAVICSQPMIGPEVAAPLAAVQSNIVLVPSWNQNGVVVGVVVERLEAMNGLPSVEGLPQPGEPHMDAVGRFARSEETGELLVIRTTFETSQSNARLPVVLICHFKFEGTTVLHHSSIHCDATRLSMRPKLPSTFVESAVCCEISGQNRDCAFCWRRKDSGEKNRCSCTLTLSRPSGGLDFSQFKANGRIIFGEFVGPSVIYIRPIHKTASIFQKLTVQTSTSTCELPKALSDSLLTTMRGVGVRSQLTKGFACRGVPLAASQVLQSVLGALDPAYFLSSETLQNDRYCPDTPYDVGMEGRLTCSLDGITEICDLPRYDQRLETAEVQMRGSAQEFHASFAQLERRRKNKEAAVRSNQRRKERKEKLEKDLKGAREKEAILRRQHASLLACNSALKTRAANAWMSSIKFA